MSLSRTLIPFAGALALAGASALWLLPTDLTAPRLVSAVEVDVQGKVTWRIWNPDRLLDRVPRCFGLTGEDTPSVSGGEARVIESGGLRWAAGVLRCDPVRIEAQTLPGGMSWHLALVRKVGGRAVDVARSGEGGELPGFSLVREVSPFEEGRWIGIRSSFVGDVVHVRWAAQDASHHAMPMQGECDLAASDDATPRCSTDQVRLGRTAGQLWFRAPEGFSPAALSVGFAQRRLATTNCDFGACIGSGATELVNGSGVVNLTE